MTWFGLRLMNTRVSSPSLAPDWLGTRLRAVPLHPFIPAQRGPGSPGVASAFPIVLLIRVVNPYARIAGLADVTDRGAPQKEEVERRFEVEVPAPAEHTIFGTGNIRPRIFRHGKAAIGTRKIPFRPLESEAIPRVADRAGYEYFPLNL